MSNHYFQFKQFRIDQENAAMKVSTDACIFGAASGKWLSEHFSEKSLDILDIGSGTGLLSLMLKQVLNESQIDAVEIDNHAFKDLSKNIKNSPWKKDIQSYHIDIRDFQSPKKYDVIICNPPFFEKQLQSQEVKRLKARHTTHLAWKELIVSVESHIKKEGVFALLLPLREWNDFVSLLGSSWQILACHYVQPNQKKLANRVLIFLSQEKEREDTALYFWRIYEEQNQYSEEMKELLREFYLFLPT